MSIPEQRLPMSRSLADIRAEQADNLDRMRSKLAEINLKDLVPILVARQVLRTYEMGAVYSKEGKDDQLDKFIEILKTKNHWMGPMIDALIRNGQTALAEDLLKLSSGLNGKAN
ncbi:Caspase Recruitment [Aphelenchoides avenae]|nr:Caspase Recruitment [Aphelenchus avenae]